MFEPKYIISNVLLENIKRITEIITQMNFRRFPAVVLAEMERRARELTVFSSTSIEGNPLPLTDVKRILKNHPKHVRDSEREVLNYNNAIVELNDAVKEKKRKFDVSLVLRIQQMVTDGLIDTHRLGRLREEPVFVNNPKTRQVAYLPPEQKDVPNMMRELFEYVEKAKSTIDSLIIAGIFHKQFVVIHPFADGNGRTARLATKALLADMGVDTFHLFSFENYYNRNVSRYFEEVGVFGNYYDVRDNIDFTSWLEYFTAGIIDELLRVKKEMEQQVVSPKTVLLDYHKKIIAYIEKHGFIHDRDYAQMTTRAKPTRNLDFRKLIELGIIEKEGKGKATYYWLKK